MATLIFDCDGVLADTERDGHLPAFRQMFREFGLPVDWSEEEYGRLLAIGGGRERLSTLLTTAFVREAGLPEDPALQAAEVARWHGRKTEIYLELVATGRLPARPGVARLAHEAAAAGWQLCVCSTSAEPSVRAILEHVAGPELAARFLVLAGDVVSRKKPAPDIYRLALERLGVAPEDAVVIEDSHIGLEAATGAGLTCVVTVSGYTATEDFHEAALVLTCLGDTDREPAVVLANRCGVTVGPEVTLAVLLGCMEG